MRCRRPHALSLLLLVAYTCASVGTLPSPTMIARIGGGTVQERFPCESCGCGCPGPRHCWTACCCFDAEGRAAWAARHHVVPPPYAVLPRRAVTTVPVRDTASCDHCDSEDGGPIDGDDEPGHHGGKSPLQCRGLSSMSLAAPLFEITRRIGLRLVIAVERAGPLANAATPAQPVHRVPTPPPRV